MDIMDIKELNELGEFNKKHFKDEKECYDFLMFQLQNHMVEIEDLKSGNDPNATKKAADIAIIAHMLALHEGADSKIFKERVNATKKVIKENKNNI